MRELTPLYYITSAALPTPKAGSVQVMQMCAGLATQAETTLVLPRAAQPQPAASLLRHYDVPANFAVLRLPRRAHAHLWRLHAVRHVHRQRGSAWLCYARGRDVLAACGPAPNSRCQGRFFHETPSPADSIVHRQASAIKCRSLTGDSPSSR